MKTAIAVVAIAFTVSHAARADSLMGYGSIRCSSLNTYYAKAPDLMGTIVEQWVGGFFSGLNAASSQERDIPEDAIDKLGPSLKAFCAANPGQSPAGEAIKAWIAMPKVKKSS